MAGIIIDGYQWVNKQWQPIEEGAIELGNPEKESAADRQIFHNSLRLFYYLKHEDRWLRATLNEENKIQWTTLVLGTYPRWSPIGPHDSLLRSLKEQQENIHETLTQAQQIPLPQIEEPKQEAVYSGSLSPAYQAIVKATLAHNLDKPSELTPAEWQMILKTSLYTDQVPEGLSNIRNDLRLLRAYQGISVFLMIDKINQYKFTINENLPTLGQIYDYSAWLIFQELENISDFTPPTLSDLPLASKKVGELQKVEQLVYQGLDASQEKIYLALINMFTLSGIEDADFEDVIQMSIDNFAINELQVMNELFRANRLGLPLTEGQARIWDEFLSTVAEGDFSLEEFGNRLDKFKTIDLESVTNPRIDRLAMIIDMFKNSSGDWVTEPFSADLLTVAMISCPQEEIEQLLMSLMHLPMPRFMDARIECLVAFSRNLPPARWEIMMKEPRTVSLLHKRFKDSANFIPDILRLFPNQEALCDFLANYPWGQRDSLQFTLMKVKDTLSNETFEHCLFDPRIIKLISVSFNQLSIFANTIVPPSKLLQFLCIPSVMNSLIINTRLLLHYLRRLPEEDQLTFLGLPAVTNIVSHDENPATLEQIFTELSSQNQAALTTTEAGLRLLSKLHSPVHFLSVFDRLPNEIGKIYYTLRWSLNNPARFPSSVQTILAGFSLSLAFEEFVNSHAFFEWIAGLDPLEKAKAHIELAIFLLNTKSANPLQTRVSHRILQEGEYSRRDIYKILLALPTPNRLQFFLSEQVLTQWKNSSKEVNLRLALIPLLACIPDYDEAILLKLEPLIETPSELEFFFDKCTPPAFCDLMLKSFQRFEDIKLSEEIQAPNEIANEHRSTCQTLLKNLDNPSFISHLDHAKIKNLLEFSNKLKMAEVQGGALSEPLDSLISSLSSAIIDESIAQRVKRRKRNPS